MGSSKIAAGLSRNILSSWTGYVIQIATMVLLTPLVLESLGASRYGVWALLSTITGYYGLLDVGARASLTRNIARYHALGDYARMNRVASAGLAALLACAAVLLLTTFACAAFATRLFHLPPEVAGEFRWAVMLVGIPVAAQFCFFVHSAALGARQRHDLATACHILAQIVYALGVPLLLAVNGGLIGLSLWFSATNLLAYALCWRVARRVIPELAPSLRLADGESFREFATCGVGQFVVNLSQQVIGYSDALVISMTMNITAVAPFYLANRVARCFARFFMPIGVILFPVLTHLDALGSREEIRRIYLRGSRWTWMLSLGLGAIGTCWASDFFALWVGERQDGFQGRVSDLFMPLLAAAAVTAPQQMALPVYLALGRQNRLSSLFIAEAIANIGLSLVLVRSYGLVGIAWGTCLPALVFQGILHPLVTCRMLKISARIYLSNVVLRPLVFAAALVLVFSNRPGFPIDGWVMLMLAGLSSTAIVAIVALATGMNADERGLFARAARRPITQWIGPLLSAPTRALRRPTRGAKAPGSIATTDAERD